MGHSNIKRVVCLQTGDLKGVLSQLEAAMKLSQQLEDSSHDADIWGEMADTYADLGDFEKAAQVVNFLNLLCVTYCGLADRALFL